MQTFLLVFMHSPPVLVYKKTGGMIGGPFNNKEATEPLVASLRREILHPIWDMMP